MANRKFLVAESGPDGTAGAPTYSFSSSTTTGLYYVATGGLGLATSANSRLTINSAGNVTVAAVASGANLTLTGTAAVTALSITGGGFSPWEIVPVASSPNSIRIRYGDGTGWSMQIAPGSGANVDKAALRIYDTGKIGWADPTTGTEDVTLTRPATGVIGTDGAFRFTGANPALYMDSINAANRTNVIFYTQVTAEANRQFQIRADGKHDWGPGGATALDTNLYRSAASVLKTDNSFQSAVDSSAYIGTANQVVMGRTASGVPGPGITFGSAQDTNVYRAQANQLKTDHDLAVAGVVFGFNSVFAQVATSTQVALGNVNGFPGILFGSAVDTNLYRGAANLLETDSNFQVKGNVGFNGKTPVAPADYMNVAYVPLNAIFASSGQGVVLTTVTTFPGAGGGLTLVAGSGIPLNPTWGIDKETNPDYITLNQLASRVKTIVNQLQAVGIFV